jgi:hypothetical protein
LQLTGAFDTRSYGFTAGGRSLQSTLGLELSLPLVWRRGQAALFSLTPGYRRRALLVEALAETGDLGLDLADGLAALAGQPYWFTGVPATELFSPATDELFREASQTAVKATYTPELFLSMSRVTSSRLRDLFLPSSAEVAVDRELSKDGDLFGSRNRVRLTLQSRALNLFGALGAYPLFRFYRTDEASGSVQVTSEVGQDSLEWLTVQAGQFLSCEAEEGRLTVENLFQYTQEQNPYWSDTLGALFSWTRRPPQGVRLPLLRAEVGEQAFWQHEESCKVAVAGGFPAEQTTALHPLNLLLGHSTTLTLPEFGYLKGVLQLGLDAEEVRGEGFYWRVGLKAGLEVRLEF